MSNRYVLDTSGKIKKVNSDGTKYEEVSNNDLYSTLKELSDGDTYSETYLSNHKKNPSNSFSTSTDTDFFNVDQDALENEVKYVITDNKPSFGFIDDNGISVSSTTQKAFRQINSFVNTNNGDSTSESDKVTPYYQEFEFYTGVRDINIDETSIIGMTALLAEYIVDVFIEAAAIEALLNIYQFAQGTNNYYTLVLGDYVIDEADVFSRYFFDVLNYPIEKLGGFFGERNVGIGTYIVKKYACYVIGLNEWLSTDRIIDWDRLFQNAVESELKGLQKAGGQDPADYYQIRAAFSGIVTAGIDMLFSSTSNPSSLKRIMLLIKKFNTQKHWVRQYLYKAKDPGSFYHYIVDNYNYYFFKFYIERFNVGLKVWNRNLDITSLKRFISTYIKSGSSNRNIGQFSNKNITKEIKTDDNSADIANLLARLYIEEEPSERKKLINKIRKDLKEKTTPRTVNYNFKYNIDKFNVSEIPTALINTKEFYDKKDDLGHGRNLNLDEKFFVKPSADNENRLPIELVNLVESHLESEYMPFYFHDVRTNEILSFHAFIENISDSYSPEYTTQSGFGRLDDVRSYVKTTRSISFSFIIAAMSKKDHDYMWYYINKLVTMVYPQWSKGEELVVDKKTIQQPFSQVPGNSPMIRVRIGDIIKSNYSRFNLARIFGLEKPHFSKKENIETWKKNYSTTDGNNIPPPPTLTESAKSQYDIMKPFKDNSFFDINNPITHAFETNMSKGLAGHITQLDFNYTDATWEIDEGSRAPQMVKVNVNFAPVHDIQLGLDSSGAPRAANYQVGKINNFYFTDDFNKKEETLSFDPYNITKYHKKDKDS